MDEFEHLSLSRTASIEELHGFRRIRLEIGQQSQQVEFELTAGNFQLADSNGEWHLQVGRWTVEIGQPVALVRQIDVAADDCSLVPLPNTPTEQSVLLA